MYLPWAYEIRFSCCPYLCCLDQVTGSTDGHLVAGVVAGRRLRATMSNLFSNPRTSWLTTSSYLGLKGDGALLLGGIAMSQGRRAALTQIACSLGVGPQGGPRPAPPHSPTYPFTGVDYPLPVTAAAGMVFEKTRHPCNLGLSRPEPT